MTCKVKVEPLSSHEPLKSADHNLQQQETKQKEEKQQQQQQRYEMSKEPLLLDAKRLKIVMT